MSPVREKFVRIIESLPYDIQEEIYKRKTFDILKKAKLILFRKDSD